VNLTALNSPDPRLAMYNGMTIFVDRTQNTPVSITGNAGSEITGTVYAAGSPVSISGNGDVNIGWQYISRTLSVTGNGTVSINYNAGRVPRQRVIQLVE